MSRFSDPILCWGHNEPPDPGLHWESGMVSLVYQAGTLRQIQIRGLVVVQQVYVAVRDAEWNTVLPRIVQEDLEASGDRFRATIEAEHVRDEIHFRWKGVIEVDGKGSLSFSVEGETQSSFWKNRIGLCVLHPATQCAGKSCRIQHGSGGIARARFPDAIEPGQPIPGFEDIRALSYRPAPGLDVELGFGGDWFEMEDQRNWSDDSFKTYSTSVRLPHPVRVAAGTPVVHSFRLAVRQSESRRPSGRSPIRRRRVKTGQARPLVLEESHGAIPLPALGLAMASHREPLPLSQLELLRQLKLSHLQCTWNLGDDRWIEDFQLAAEQSEDLNLPLEAVLILPAAPRAALSRLSTELGRTRPDIARWIVVPAEGRVSGEADFGTIRKHLHQLSRGARIGGGTRGDFVELNQARPALKDAEFVSFGVNSQVHTFDNASILQNLRSIAAPVKAARQIWGQLPVRISSLTWKPPSPWRAEEKGSGSLPTNVDPRQMSLFGAGWAVGALSRLFGASVAGITLLETTGWLGVMERPEGCSLPDLFPSLPGGVFPLYHVLADCAEFRDGSMLPVRTSRDSDIQILRLRSNRANAWVLANPTAFPQTVVLKHLSGRVMIRKLEVGNALLSMQHPGHFRKREVEVIKGLRGTLRLELPPFSCQRVSW